MEEGAVEYPSGTDTRDLIVGGLRLRLATEETIESMPVYRRCARHGSSEGSAYERTDGLELNRG